MRAYLVGVATLLSLCLASQNAPTQELDKGRSLDRAASLERLAMQTSNLEEFGRAVLKQALLAAARQQREGRATGNTIQVQLPFSLREIEPPRSPRPPDLPKPPDPSTIDVCWETCGSVACYVDCSNPVDLDITAGLAARLTAQRRRCDDLQRQLANLTDQRVRGKILVQMIIAGCSIDITPYLATQPLQ